MSTPEEHSMRRPQDVSASAGQGAAGASTAPVSDARIRQIMGEQGTPYSPATWTAAEWHSVCDELLRTRALLREAKPALEWSATLAKTLMDYPPCQPYAPVLRKLIEACP